MEDLDPGRSRREHEAGQLADLRALGLDWDGPVVRQSERRERHREALAALRAAGRTYPAGARAPRSARRRRPRTAPAARRAPIPGTCRRLSAAERAERERAGRPPALRLDARGERDRASSTGCAGRSRRSSTTSCCGAATACPRTTSRSSSTTPTRASREVVRGDDLLESTPRQLLLGRLLGPARAGVRARAAGARRRRRRLAKRHGAVTLADRAARGETPRGRARVDGARASGSPGRGERIDAGRAARPLRPRRGCRARRRRSRTREPPS